MGWIQKKLIKTKVVDTLLLTLVMSIITSYIQSYTCIYAQGVLYSVCKDISLYVQFQLIFQLRYSFTEILVFLHYWLRRKSNQVQYITLSSNMRSVIEENNIEEILPLIIQTPPDLKSRCFVFKTYCRNL